MIIREAKVKDITQIQIVRNAVKENMRPDPNLVTDKDCAEFITERGKGWVSIINDRIVGFSIVDLKDQNIRALFIHPDFENKGMGRQLHDVMINWYFTQTKTTVWLGTALNTRAEMFDRKSGWIETGVHGKGEVKYEMSCSGGKK